MTLVWTLVGLSVALLLLAFVRSRQRSQRDSDLGTVSHQWLAEQRLGRGDSQR